MRQMFEQRRFGNEQQQRHGKGSPVGWDKSYPLDPVEAVNNEVRTPIYKQNVTRNNSYNKYSGNYGPKAGANNNSTMGKRGLSLDRVSRGRQSQVSSLHLSVIMYYELVRECILEQCSELHTVMSYLVMSLLKDRLC